MVLKKLYRNFKNPELTTHEESTERNKLKRQNWKKVTNLGSNKSGSSKKYKRIHKNLDPKPIKGVKSMDELSSSDTNNNIYILNTNNKSNTDEILNENDSSFIKISCIIVEKVTNLGSRSSKKKHKESKMYKYIINLSNSKLSKCEDLEKPSKNLKNKKFFREYKFSKKIIQKAKN
ncbi:21770_t:CDS:2 [Dentiscutata erythropus]|uniref:21770_t:CDS:1 n=1 Tax=Dentiscutata erythropus TaxID=1348616 RepID=A0A9N9IMA8_9GLOM|nr:21770_t:CDS:2 [Dentiscutata erythropus]